MPPRHIPQAWRVFSSIDRGMDAASIQRSFAEHVQYSQARDQYSVTDLDLYQSLARTVRDRLLDRWSRTQQRHYRADCRRVYYLSLEYLIGRMLRENLQSLGILEESREALAALDIELDPLLELEEDAGLGNGGLGRLAACFMDSLATLDIPAMGYGIRYEYGIFRQEIRDGEQVERPDNWLRYGCPWEIPRPENLYPVRFGGRVVVRQEEGRTVFSWEDTELVMAMAYDLLVPGYRNGVVHTLRLWSAKASREFDLHDFNRGDYVLAVYEKNATENISRVLYPSDTTRQGKELRLKQEYFFVSATLQDAIRRHLKTHRSLDDFADKAVFQLNDTHPSLAVAELMRLLVDEHGYAWDPAWRITTRALAYTNHTVMPEALEEWPVELFGSLLPRHLQLVYEINARFLAQVRFFFPGDEARVQRMSIIREQPERRVRMAHLALVGSHAVNGVSRLHAQLLKEELFRDFAELWPGRFHGITNGITPRRWLLGCNPELAALITERVGEGWVTDLDRLRGLEEAAEDPDFRERWRAARRRNKERLAAYVRRCCGLELDPGALFGAQVKRIHEYKRQLLAILHVLALYRRFRREGGRSTPRVFFFAGKAAPAYRAAKSIIRLIHAVADLVNGDPENDVLRVVFLPNYSVSLAELVVPAADLSEQISVAGTEASGTGNMKFALNGALTLGTLDGANIEILEAVGEQSFFPFGLDVEGVRRLRAEGYDPRAFAARDFELRDALEALGSGALCPNDPHRFDELLHGLLDGGDPFLVLADFADYRDAQLRVEEAWRDQEAWTRASILATARMGRFSSDRAVREYAAAIWHARPLGCGAGDTAEGRPIRP